MARATEGAIRGNQGDPFLYNPNPSGSDRGRPEILGYPVYNSAAASAIAASAKSVIFGNFRYMGMREAPGITFLRDPYGLAHLGQVRLLYYFRTVYKTLQAEAIQYATHPTA
jgi:HK97 family phage major capsid protein